MISKRSSVDKPRPKNGCGKTGVRLEVVVRRVVVPPSSVATVDPFQSDLVLEKAPMSPIDPIRRHVTDHSVSDALTTMERVAKEAASEAAKAADAALDVVIEETATLTFFGLSRFVGDGAAQKFVELGLRTRGRVGYPATRGKRVAFWVGAGAGVAALLYRFGAVDALLRRWAQRAWSRRLGTRVTVRSLAFGLFSGRLRVEGVRVDEWDPATAAPALCIGAATIAWSSSALGLVRANPRGDPVELAVVELADVDLRLHREADGALNWASANASVRRRRTVEALEVETTSSSDASSSDSDPPVARFLLPLEDTSESDDDGDRPNLEYGARWWRRRDVAAIAETCGASYVSPESSSFSSPSLRSASFGSDPRPACISPRDLEARAQSLAKTASSSGAS